MKRIVIAGGAGFLGQALAAHLEGKGWESIILTRSPDRHHGIGRAVAWDSRSLGPWTQELEGARALVNLCGKSVNCRYHRRNREAILQSRLAPTKLLGNALAGARKPPPVWINASSATIYKHSHSVPMTERDGEIGDGFSVDVCKAWEDAVFESGPPATRRVILRTSMVLGHAANSVLPVLKRLAKFGLGGRLSHGDQMVSWIHQSDFARAVAFAIANEDLEGPINLTAPAPVTNAVFMKQIRQAVGCPFGLPHYKPLLEVAAWLMRTETELTLKSRYVIPHRLLDHRFVFNFSFIDEALADLVRHETTRDPLPLYLR